MHIDVTLHTRVCVCVCAGARRCASRIVNCERSWHGQSWESWATRSRDGNCALSLLIRVYTGCPRSRRPAPFQFFAPFLLVSTWRATRRLRALRTPAARDLYVSSSIFVKKKLENFCKISFVAMKMQRNVCNEMCLRNDTTLGTETDQLARSRRCRSLRTDTSLFVRAGVGPCGPTLAMFLHYFGRCWTL